jgi:hypothetical protein
VSNPLVRARWLAPLILLAASGLSACGSERAQARLVAAQAQADPPRLWRVESLGPSGAVTAALDVCADRTLREGFGRANAEVNGQPCISLKGGVDRPGLFAERCQIAGRRYGLTVTKSGDPEHDFTATIAVRSLDGSEVVARQMRRFREGGPCPAGWDIGDQARAGQARGVNSLAGTWDRP